ncbi:SRPBCC family protein [Aeromicrobium panaciterrae]|uniref:SRPBCC family protein n=1 Tax=Aeromicrobium panaciterrae TaxID=363861 RepID=UPI0031E35AB9
MGQPPLEAEIEIAATPDDVWAALSDVSAMKRRSPELVVMRTLGRPRVGRRVVNLNRRKGFAWPTTARITRWKPPANDDGNGAFAFHVWPTDVEWSYDLEPTSSGTRVVERRTALVAPSLSVRLTAKLALGGADNHDVELLAGMKATLAALKAEVEHGS